MFGLETLDILIGLTTIYLAFAVACTAVVEAISAWLALRAKNLETAMNELLQGDIADGASFPKAFYDHPLIETLSQGKDGRPSYLQPELVGRVIESLLLGQAAVKDSKELAARMHKAIDAMPDKQGSDGPANRVKLLLSDLLHEAQRETGDLSKNFRTAVSQQFDATMDRATGWFKRRTQLVTLLAATVLVGSNNVDTVAIATSLSSSPEARAEMVKLAADQLAEAQPAPAVAAPETHAAATSATPEAQASAKSETAAQAISEAEKTAGASGIPLGWTHDSLPASGGAWLAKLAGLLVTIFAVMLGAPFWFGVLQQLNAVRSTGKVPPTTQAKLPQQGQAPNQGQPEGG